MMLTHDVRWLVHQAVQPTMQIEAGPKFNIPAYKNLLMLRLSCEVQGQRPHG
jgi:hypothetical protein